jgi:hypothetical protein
VVYEKEKYSEETGMLFKAHGVEQNVTPDDPNTISMLGLEKCDWIARRIATTARFNFDQKVQSSFAHVLEKKASEGEEGCGHDAEMGSDCAQIVYFCSVTITHGFDLICLTNSKKCQKCL